MILVSAIKARFPEADLKVATGGFIYLRFICPYILSHDLPSSENSRFLKRGLVLVTKILQNLANNLLFGAKETFMNSMNEFLSREMPRNNEFLRALSVGLFVTLALMLN